MDDRRRIRSCNMLTLAELSLFCEGLSQATASLDEGKKSDI